MGRPLVAADVMSAAEVADLLHVSRIEALLLDDYAGSAA